MPKRYRWTFVNGGRAQLVDLAGAIGVPQRSQKWCNILLREKFFLFVINENLGWLYVLAIKTTRSSSHFRRPLKRSRHSIWPPLHQRQQDARLRPAMKALRLVSRPIAAVEALLIGRHIVGGAHVFRRQAQQEAGECWQSRGQMKILGNRHCREAVLTDAHNCIAGRRIRRAGDLGLNPVTCPRLSSIISEAFADAACRWA
jgi:hypothetical protein